VHYIDTALARLNTPVSAFMFAPSQDEPSGFMHHFRSLREYFFRRLHVLGLVIMIPATVSSKAAASTLRSMFPSFPEGMVCVTKPAIVQEAGLVPCAESGNSNFYALSLSLRLEIIPYHETPENSPCAPAAGWRETPAKPPISARLD